jgi:alpha-tubulin suppressor-like RCC1 family protein
MKAVKFSFYLLAALAMLLSLTNAQSVRAFLPRGENLAASTPPLLLNIETVDLGSFHTCALTTSGGVMCWGHNNAGQLGDGTTHSRPIAKFVKNTTSGISAIAVGSSHACALTTGGGVKCWGSNTFGQLGDGTTTDRSIPVNVSGLSSGVIAISAAVAHTCALTSGGGVKCWGSNEFGQLGDGTNNYQSNIPVNVFGLASGVNFISAGGSHTCAVTTDGGLKCWGANYGGQLGNGITGESNVPVDVSGLTSGINSVSAEGAHTCALTTSGDVKCWGSNSHGELGDGTTTNRLIPTDVVGLPEIIQMVSAGLQHTCALMTAGKAKCWGDNFFGQLGNGTTTNSLVPVDVSGITNNGSTIEAGSAHTCAVISTGGVKCWGINSDGELGDGTTAQRLAPVNVLALQEFISRSVGKFDGYVWESTETSNVGLRTDTASDTFRVGDDNLDRQYRAFLSFNTSPLPDTAVIFSSWLQLEIAGWKGYAYPLGPMRSDIRSGFFGKSIWLTPEDFQAPPSRANVSFIYTSETLVNSPLNEAAFPYINLTGHTQFRIRERLDDNNDMDADYVIFYSGDAELARRPQLVILYYVP